MAAFSLLELMFTAGLAATLAAIAIPESRASIDEARALAGARYLSGELQRTRIAAISSGRNTALRIMQTESGYVLATYADGNRNGVLASDIRLGLDAAIGSSQRLSDQFPGVDFGTLPALPPVDPGGTLPGADPVRLGASDMASFTAAGTATPGTLYLRGRGELQYAVRIFGETGKTRILKFDPRRWVWLSTQGL